MLDELCLIVRLMEDNKEEEEGRKQKKRKASSSPCRRETGRNNNIDSPARLIPCGSATLWVCVDADRCLKNNKKETATVAVFFF